MSARIDGAFARCRGEKRAALVGYLTAYDPDLAASRERIFAACEAGLDVLELGLPFSDPTADGPAIQAAMVRALAAGATPPKVLELARDVRARFDVPIVLFGYANPMFSLGVENLIASATDAGIDGLLVVDMPPETAATLRDPARAADLDWIALVALTTTPRRLRAAAAASTGFIYMVSLRGVTGAKLDVDDPELIAQLARLREHTDLPVSVGFGIRTPEQAQALSRRVDGIVVGSALVDAGKRGPAAVTDLVRGLRAGLGPG